MRAMKRLVMAALTLVFAFIMGTSAVPAGAAEIDLAPSAASLTSELVALQATRGTRAALVELERRSRFDGQVAGLCHAVAHELGHRALDLARGRLASALSVRSDVCGGGYVHGAVEHLLASSKHPARELASTCKPTDGSCWHGVGHGLMFATRMEVESSLALCASAPSALVERRCGEGVFMQLFNAESSSAAAVPTRVQAAQQCEKTAAPQTANCWFYAPNVVLARDPDAFSDAMRWCASQSSEVGRQVCARGVGSRTVKRHSDDLAIGTKICSAAGQLQGSCLGGMASYWSVHWEGRKSPSSMCKELTALRRECQAAVRG